MVLLGKQVVSLEGVHPLLLCRVVPQLHLDPGVVARAPDLAVDAADPFVLDAQIEDDVYLAVRAVEVEGGRGFGLLGRPAHRLVGDRGRLHEGRLLRGPLDRLGPARYVAVGGAPRVLVVDEEEHVVRGDEDVHPADAELVVQDLPRGVEAEDLAVGRREGLPPLGDPAVCHEGVV